MQLELQFFTGRSASQVSPDQRTAESAPCLPCGCHCWPHGGKREGEQSEVPGTFTKQTSPQRWGARGLGLDEDDRKRIMINQWLSNKHIKACSTLLKKAHPSQSGLRDTITLAKKPLQCISPTDFVQIVHVNQSHRVCLSKINCPPGVIDVYDSIPNYSVNSKVPYKQAAAISQCMEKQLELIYRHRKQAMTVDSLLLLLPLLFVMVLILMGCLWIKMLRMRQHLAGCFEEGEFPPFKLSQVYFPKTNQASGVNSSVLQLQATLRPSGHFTW